MSLRILFLALGLMVSVCADGADFTDAKMRYDLARSGQSIGRVSIAPDASVILYEWLRPYDWKRDTTGLAAGPAKRDMAWLYQVKVRAVEQPTSEYTLMANGGASYYLGSLSPDHKHITFYRVNDDNTVNMGVARLADLYQTFFDVTPNDARLDEPPVWLTNDTFIYPAKLETGEDQKLVLANLRTGKTQEYKGPTPIMPTSGLPPQPKGLPADTTLLAISADGSVEVFQQSNADILKLYIKRNGGEAEIIFENKRHD